jgi:hypothetical protein
MDTDKRQSMFIYDNSDEKQEKDKQLLEEQEKSEILNLKQLSRSVSRYTGSSFNRRTKTPGVDYVFIVKEIYKFF